MVARDDLCIFLLNEELFATPESSKSQGSYNVPILIPKDPIIFSADNWGVQSPPQYCI